MIPQTLSHFRVLEQIGAGGMGVVYRAHDEQLDRDVALKVLPAGMLADEGARRRFHREALAVARLNHPNVGAVYEFGGQAGLDFLVMELVSGVTLNARLASGPLTFTEVVRLGMQLADGLEAAHAEGVIHRDLKPGNLRLTTDGRLKILDFGLARMQRDSDAAPTITAIGSSDVSGTVPYMAPEQLRGNVADARSDVYAAGAVLYEMATGARPFGRASGPQLVSAILETAPLPPRSRNRHVPPSLERVILKALDKNPDRRYQSARELRVDLERLSDGSAPRAQQFRLPRLVVAASALLVLLALLVGLNVGSLRDRLLRRPPVAASVLSIKSRRSLAVLGFKNLSGRPDDAWMSTALAEMLTTEMAAGEQLRTISGEDVVRMKIDLALSDADSFGKETLGRIRSHLGSDLVILGSYLALGNSAGGRIRVDFRLQDTVAGETLAATSATGAENELIDLIARTGAELRQKLGVDQVSVAGASDVRASLPVNSEAARLYSEGLARLRLFEALQARDLLERAVLADPSHAPAHSALAAAWSALGYDTRAQDHARQAFDRSARLSREERLSIEGRYREFTRDWPKAIDIYRTLSGFFPDSLEYGLRLAAAQMSSGQSKDALAALDGLRRLPAPAGDDARIDLAESRTAGALGDFKRALESARRAAEKGRRQGARLVVAQARSAEGFALERLGQLNDGTAAFSEAQQLFSAAGDKLGAAVALQMNGNVLLDKADFAGARKAFDDALAVFRQLGTQQRIAATLNNIGNVLYDQGELDQARKHYDEVLRIDREIGDRRGMAGALGNLANVLDEMGDLAGARTMQEECLAQFRQIGDSRGTASTLNNLGNVLAELGDLSGAKQKYEESLVITEQIGYKRGQAFSKFGLGDVLAAQGHLDDARAAAEQALVLRKDLGDENNLAWTRTQLAAIALEQGRPHDAEPLARDAADAFGRVKADENGAVANALLAGILLEEGKTAEAQGAADRALSLSQRSSSRFPRFEATLASARVMIATARTAEAARKLESLLAETRKHGYLAYEYQARLSLGTAEMKSGRIAAARARLTALERDAREKGFELIVRKSAKARR
jgi:serine/threonine protein kinase/tetratricopeptide (TPR) repeat protein